MSFPDGQGPVAPVLSSLSKRWIDYRAATVDTTIAPVDDMYRSDLDHYLSVGVSAIDVLTEAMLATRRTSFARILDLPCGGGRVTRHLRAFFPDAEIVVSDLDKAKQSAVMAQFRARGLDVPADFAGEPAEQFDLMFVGSMFTHFEEPVFRRAFDFLVKSLTNDGIAVLTMHGRTVARNLFSWRRPNQTLAPLRRSGFGHHGHGFHGLSLSLPSWVSRLVEARGDARIVMFKERGWANFQDVLVVRKSEGEWTPAWRSENQLERLARHLDLGSNRRKS